MKASAIFFEDEAEDGMDAIASELGRDRSEARFTVEHIEPGSRFIQVTGTAE